MIFLYQISCYNGFINLFDIIGPVILCSVNIRTCQTTFYGIVIKKLISVLHIFIIFAVLLKTEREYMNFDIPSGKKSCQIRAKQERIGACHVNIIFSLRIETVDRQFKLRAHLYFIHEKIVCFPGLITILYIPVQCMIFLDFFIRQIHKVNENNIDIFKMIFQVLHIRLHQF